MSLSLFCAGAMDLRQLFPNCDLEVSLEKHVISDCSYSNIILRLIHNQETMPCILYLYWVY